MLPHDDPGHPFCSAKKGLTGSNSRSVYKHDMEAFNPTCCHVPEDSSALAAGFDRAWKAPALCSLVVGGQDPSCSVDAMPGERLADHFADGQSVPARDGRDGRSCPAQASAPNHRTGVRTLMVASPDSEILQHPDVAIHGVTHNRQVASIGRGDAPGLKTSLLLPQGARVTVEVDVK